MKILYVALKYDFGVKERGHSFTHWNFHDTLVRMGHDVLYFDFFTMMQEQSRNAMNRRLWQIARSEKPDLMFTVLFGEQLSRSTVRKISRKLDTVTLNWFCDDHFRFEDFTRHWAPCFNWSVTTSHGALAKYEKIGCKSVIKSQWACNPFIYKKLDLPLKYDVSFVGVPHGNRRELIDTIRKAGFDVQTWGRGWPAGRISQEEMIAVFNQSRINLNVTNSCRTPTTRLGAFLHRMPLGYRIEALSKRLSGRPRGPATATATEENELLVCDPNDQIKGRNFEVPACGGLLLTGTAENLDDYYRDNREIACFSTAGELIDKIRFYLDNEPQRAAVARAGYERTLNEHTYVHRFTEIFKRIGLTQGLADNATAGTRPCGQSEDVQ